LIIVFSVFQNLVQDSHIEGTEEETCPRIAEYVVKFTLVQEGV